jgi:hypothetical protein
MSRARGRGAPRPPDPPRRPTMRLWSAAAAAEQQCRRGRGVPIIGRGGPINDMDGPTDPELHLARRREDGSSATSRPTPGGPAHHRRRPSASPSRRLTPRAAGVRCGVGGAADPLTRGLRAQRPLGASPTGAVVLETRFTRLVGCTVPVQQAGMGPGIPAELSVAVSEDGGLGMLGFGFGGTPDAVSRRLARAGPHAPAARRQLHPPRLTKAHVSPSDEEGLDSTAATVMLGVSSGLRRQAPGPPSCRCRSA